MKVHAEALFQDAVRGLMWFLHGANSVVVPRGVLYSSTLFAAMNGSWDPGSPLSNATIHGNSNNLSSLNSRVIQMVITKNATLAQAWGILDLALANATGMVCSVTRGVDGDTCPGWTSDWE